jgi:hypothetical protein
MKKRLLTFEGGLQTKVAPHLAQPNQSVECENIDLTKGSIYPLKGYVSKEYLDGETDLVTGYSNIMYEGILISSEPSETRSYARYGSRLYFTNGTHVLDGDSVSYGLYRAKANGEIVDAVPPSTPNGTITESSKTDGLLNGTYSYVYTLIDDDGIESTPSSVYTLSANASDSTINLSFGASSSVTEDVSYIRIYRTGGSNPTWNLIHEKEWDNTGSYTYSDNTPDIDVSRIELASFDSTAPLSNLQYLTESNGTLFSSVGDRVYFSNNGRPEFWSPLDFLVLDDECTGLGTYRDTVVAFTESSTYVISGFNRDNITLDRLPYNEGCLNNESIANVTELLVWASKNGICAYNGGSVELVTRNILEWDTKITLGESTFDSLDFAWDDTVGYDVTNSIGFGGIYYAIYANGIGLLDFNNNARASVISYSEPIRDIFLDDSENTLVIVTDEGAYKVDNDEDVNLTARWKTPEITDETDTSIKQYRKVELSQKPTQVDIFIDGSLVKSVSNKRIFFLPSGCYGRNIQFDIYTDNEIRSLKYEYGVLND